MIPSVSKLTGGIFVLKSCDIATERRLPLTQLCLTALFIIVLYDITKVVIKKMELSYMDKKNQKEGRYMN